MPAIRRAAAAQGEGEYGNRLPGSESHRKPAAQRAVVRGGRCPRRSLAGREVFRSAARNQTVHSNQSYRNDVDVECGIAGVEVRWCGAENANRGNPLSAPRPAPENPLQTVAAARGITPQSKNQEPVPRPRRQQRWGRGQRVVMAQHRRVGQQVETVVGEGTHGSRTGRAQGRRCVEKAAPTCRAMSLGTASRDWPVRSTASTGRHPATTSRRPATALKESEEQLCELKTKPVFW
ncbi:hypothetical protein NPIL_273311 [Nephila pilipes]|uniref:Uncharacterized protein n=1 Tax=Nephila pilipes TaxID=299642 RepID=A0A8X6THN0_NEPPI|nr:hypothetical protein NPIL_273311 [Nephila pilipes]